MRAAGSNFARGRIARPEAGALQQAIACSGAFTHYVNNQQSSLSRLALPLSLRDPPPNILTSLSSAPRAKSPKLWDVAKLLRSIHPFISWSIQYKPKSYTIPDYLKMSTNIT